MLRNRFNLRIEFILDVQSELRRIGEHRGGATRPTVAETSIIKIFPAHASFRCSHVVL